MSDNKSKLNVSEGLYVDDINNLQTFHSSGSQPHWINKKCSYKIFWSICNHRINRKSHNMKHEYKYKIVGKSMLKTYFGKQGCVAFTLLRLNFYSGV